MNYWLTTHWPPREDVKDKFQDTGAWVRDGHENVLKEMQPGDKLVIYESKSGKTSVEKTADGAEKKVPRVKGKEGVIALAEITSKATDIGDDGRETYSDGTKTWWRYKAKADVVNSKGFIGRPTLARLLGYSEKYSFRGFGDQNSGVRQLTKETFEAIHVLTTRLKLLKFQRGQTARRPNTFITASTPGTHSQPLDKTAHHFLRSFFVCFV